MDCLNILFVTFNIVLKGTIEMYNTRAGLLVLKYHFLNTCTRDLLYSEYTLTQKLFTRYWFEKAIEYTSTLSNGKARCTSALKCQSNFVLPRIKSKYFTTSVCLSFIVQVQALNFYFKHDQLLSKTDHGFMSSKKLF